MGGPADRINGLEVEGDQVTGDDLRGPLGGGGSTRSQALGWGLREEKGVGDYECSNCTLEYLGRKQNNCI